MRRLYIACLLSIFLIFGCGNRQDSESESSAGSQERVIPARIAAVEKRTIVDRLTARAEIVPLREVDIFPTVAGKIISESVELGHVVKKGRTLARLIQDVPGMEFSPVNIEATLDGTVTFDGVEIGAKVTPQKPVYRISRLDSVWVDAYILESDLGKIKVGDAAEIMLNAYPDEKFAGKIRELSPVVDKRSRTVTARILLPNPDRRLKPGLSVSCLFTVGRHENLVVPLDAVVHSGMSKYIFKVLGDRVKKTPIRTGAVMDALVEVEGDLTHGDQIVIYGQNLLQDGDRINPME